MATDRRIGRRAAVALVLLLVVVLAGLALWAASRHAGSGARPSSSGTPVALTPTPSPTDPAPSDSPSAPQSGATTTASGAVLSDQEATEVVAEAMGAVSDALRTPAQVGDLSSRLSGAALEAFENQRQEWEAQGWTQSGAPTLEGLRLVEEDPSGTRVRVEVCVDSSGVSVHDDTGAQIRPPSDPQRSLNVLLLVDEGGTWKLAEQTFADPPQC